MHAQYNLGATLHALFWIFRLDLFACAGLLGWWRWGASTLVTGETSTGETSATGVGSVTAACSGGVSRGGSGGTGAISSPPWSSRHTCSRLTSVWFNRCSP